MMVKFCTSCGFRSDLCHCNSGNCRKLTDLLKYDIAKSTSIQMGSQGPPGPTGPGSALFLHSKVWLLFRRMQVIFLLSE